MMKVLEQVSDMPAAAESRTVVDLAALDQLIPSLVRRGYQVIGPTLRDGAIVYENLRTLQDLPAGWTDEQEAGSYRLKKRDDGALFGYVVGPQSWKKFLHPPETRLFEAQREGESFRILNNAAEPPRYAFLGVRSCELAAMRVQDRVLMEDRFADPIYQGRRRQVFVVAVNCTQSASTCFCTSMKTGPRVSHSFDLVLTEVMGGDKHQFVVEVGSAAGEEVLGEIEHRDAPPAVCRQADEAVERAALQVRSMDTTGIRELLYENFDHPRWDNVASRCLSCANCTMVCPTCFCTTVEDVSDVAGDHAERWRRWDSCFTQEFSYIHGGSVRSSPKARYRQWMTHKLASWIDQFGSSGCVGCGRCITWCPVGIDITEEVCAIRDGSSIPKPGSVEDDDGDA
jgi:formate hydrogenlyase subunit 6/NADH:ubiquinone oxidoreductase subunit I